MPIWGRFLSEEICKTANRLPNLKFRADAASEFSVSRISWAVSTNEGSHEYLIAKIGAVWTSTLDDYICTTPHRRGYVIRAASKPKAGTTDRLAGSLADVFPEFKKTSEEDIERRLRRMRQ
jgi:hypothetical protein